jgi:hypothetical protein
VQVLELDALPVLRRASGQDALHRDHAGHAAGARQDLDPLAREHLRVPHAEAAEGEEPALVGVGDDDADLVDVPEEREQRPAGRAGDARDGVADPVGRHLGEPGRRLAPDLRDGRFRAGRARRLEQAAQDRGDRQRARDPNLTEAPCVPTLKEQ